MEKNNSLLQLWLLHSNLPYKYILKCLTLEDLITDLNICSLVLFPSCYLGFLLKVIIPLDFSMELKCTSECT